MRKILFTATLLATVLTAPCHSQLIAGGELGNSAASSVADIDSVFPRLAAMGLNTVLVPVYWDLLEPQEGQFDFTLTDATIDAARRYDMQVVPLWFGAWKNSMSCYAPAWVKADYERFPRARTRAGKPLEILSAFSDEVFRADSAAFDALTRHIAARNAEQPTVTMIQIENEIGMLEDARDHSAAAQAAYDRGVPPALTRHLLADSTLHPDIVRRWTDNGGKTQGAWHEVFGTDTLYVDEYFMAYNYAAYVERLAQVAKRNMPGVTTYVNAALNSRGRRPGQYPSAGPLAHLKDIWHAAAPSIDMLAIDLYDTGFKDWMARFATDDNRLFVPEIRRADGNAAQALYVVAEHDALGLSPFAIENGLSPHDVKGYAKYREAMPVLAAHQGTGDMRGLYFEGDDIERVIDDLDPEVRITASHYFTLPWDPRATDGSAWPAAGGALIRLAPMQYLYVGSGTVLKFEHPSEATNAAPTQTGEDGFALSGNASAATPDVAPDAAQWRIGLASVDEVHVNPDGTFTPIRRYNGDETHQGRHARVGVDDYQILLIQLYKYR